MTWIRTASKAFPKPPKWHIETESNKTKCGQEILFDKETAKEQPKEDICTKCK